MANLLGVCHFFWGIVGLVDAWEEGCIGKVGFERGADIQSLSPNVVVVFRT